MAEVHLNADTQLVFVILAAHLLVPPKGLHLRDELGVILWWWNGAALGMALQALFLEQQRKNTYFKPRLLCTTHHHCIIFQQKYANINLKTGTANRANVSHPLVSWHTHRPLQLSSVQHNIRVHVCVTIKAIDNAWWFPFTFHSYTNHVKVTMLTTVILFLTKMVFSSRMKLTRLADCCSLCEESNKREKTSLNGRIMKWQCLFFTLASHSNQTQCLWLMGAATRFNN